MLLFYFNIILRYVITTFGIVFNRTLADILLAYYLFGLR